MVAKPTSVNQKVVNQAPSSVTPSGAEDHRTDAQRMYEKLARSIIDFEGKLCPNEEIGARLVNFNANEVISIENIGYWGNDLVIFYGKNCDDQHVELLQHISQVNVLLLALKVTDHEPNRIGFALQESLEKSL